jgi:hypothetical protein
VQISGAGSVCRLHHRELHTHGDEKLFWKKINIDPLPIALRLWNRGRSDHSIRPGGTPVLQQDLAAKSVKRDSVLDVSQTDEGMRR